MCVFLLQSLQEPETQILSPQRSGKLNGDHTATQLAMSWIREGREEVAKQERTGLENERGRLSNVDGLYQEGL